MNSLRFNNQLVSLLEEGLFSLGIGLDQAYDQLDAYRSKCCDNVNFTLSTAQLNDCIRKQLHSDFPTTTHAIDLPIYFRNQHNDERIMIVAMDSLPPEPESNHWISRNINLQNDICFWAPFSLIDDWQLPVGSMKSNLSFFKPLISSYSIYVTDIFKLFYRKIDRSGYKVSNQIKGFTEIDGDLHFEILKKEIELVQPSGIVILGKAAFNSINRLLTPVGGLIFPEYKISNLPCRVLALPHISGAANGAKNKFVNLPGFEFIEAKSWNEKLSRMVIHQLETSHFGG